MPVINKFDLTGRVALITGAAGLLGVEHALALARNGASVVLTDINEEQLNESRRILSEKIEDSSKIFYRPMNVVSRDQIIETASSLNKDGLRIDILINNAAIDPKVKDSKSKELTRLENFPLTQWNLELGVGLTGAFLCSQVFGSLMASDGKGGVILNIASDLSVISPDQRLYKKSSLLDRDQPVKPITYSVIKTGLIGLTRYLSTYWAAEGIRANALSPGGVYHSQDLEFVHKLESLIPLGRMAALDEYHSAIQFLCSDASSYLNGQNIVMDGGRSVW